MIVKISYSRAQLHEAAKFIWENNTSVTLWPSNPTSVFDVMKGIKEMMYSTVRKNAAVIQKDRKSVV